MANKNDSSRSRGTYLGVSDGIYQALGPIAHLMCGHEPDEFIEFRVKQRGAFDWYAMVKAVGPDGGVVVAFGAGPDAVSAIMGVAGSVSEGRWRADKPYDPGV